MRRVEFALPEEAETVVRGPNCINRRTGRENQKKSAGERREGGKNGAAGSSVGIGNLIYYTIQQKKGAGAYAGIHGKKRSPYRTDGPVTNILWRTGGRGRPGIERYGGNPCAKGRGATSRTASSRSDEGEAFGAGSIFRPMSRGNISTAILCGRKSCCCTRRRSESCRRR